MPQRSLHAATKVYYMSYVKLCQGSTQYRGIAKVSRGRPGRVTTPAVVPRPLLHRVSLGE
jgi:hypothetical protein